MMPGNKFEYGPLSRGVFVALCCSTLFIAWYYPSLLIYYVLFLLVLALLLRPILEKIGLYDFYQGLLLTADEKLNRKKNEARRREIDLKIRDEKYRKSRVRDPRLPKNW